MIDLNKAITTAANTGKVMFGVKRALKNAKMGRAKLIVVATNCSPSIKEDIEYYGRLSKIPVVIYKGTSIDLGAVCGKPFMVSALTIREPGDSDILKSIEETKEATEETETAEEVDA